MATAMLVGACGNATKSAARTSADDLVRLFRPTSVDEVVRGSGPELDEVLRRNRSQFDDAFRASSFRSAVADAESVASRETSDRGRDWFVRLDERLQRSAEQKLKTLVCKARLSAQDELGDIELIDLQPWVVREFSAIGIALGPEVARSVVNWLVDKVKDRTSTYDLACLAWVRAQQA